jgi:hypothetical protein
VNVIVSTSWPGAILDRKRRNGLRYVTSDRGTEFGPSRVRSRRKTDRQAAMVHFDESRSARASLMRKQKLELSFRYRGEQSQSSGSGLKRSLCDRGVK